MPITKSAKKALRQSLRRKIRNLKRKDAVKDLEKQVRKLLAANQREKALELLPKAYQAIDKGAKRRVITANAASRKKSRLARLLQKQAG